MPFTQQKDWYVATEEDGIVAGRFRTRRECRYWIVHTARAAGDPDPWGTMSRRDPDWPSWYVVITGNALYHVGLGACLADLNDTWCEELSHRLGEGYSKVRV